MAAARRAGCWPTPGPPSLQSVAAGQLSRLNTKAAAIPKRALVRIEGPRTKALLRMCTACRRPGGEFVCSSRAIPVLTRQDGRARTPVRTECTVCSVCVLLSHTPYVHHSPSAPAEEEGAPNRAI